MKPVRLLSLLSLALVLVNAGCAGINSTIATPVTPTSPNPTPSPTPTPAATFIYVANSGSGDISALTLNHDGSITPVPGSPFIASGVQDLAISSSYLIATRQGVGASSYRIDPASGALTHVSDAAITDALLLHLAANSSSAYVGATNGLYGYSLADGNFNPVPGSPFFVQELMEPFPPDPQRLLLDSAGSYLFAGLADDGVSGTFSALPRAADGSLIHDPAPETGPVNTLAIAEHPSRKFLYVADGGLITIEQFDPSTGKHKSVPTPNPFAAASGFLLAMAPNGKFLLSADSFGDVLLRVFTVDENSGLLTEATNSPVPGGGFMPTDMTLDPSGRFLLVVRGDDATSSSSAVPPNSLSVLSFDDAAGKLSFLGPPFQLGSLPDSVVAVRF